MLLQEFTLTPRREAAAFLTPALDVPRWIEAVVDGRPYASVDELVDTALRVASPLSAEEIDAALARHPRIGEKVDGSGAEAAYSRREQPSVDEVTAVALSEGNAAYEERFGRVFLVRAAGRSAQDILALLRARLRNSDEQELHVVERELREIAALRLRASLTPTAVTDATEGARA